MELYNVCAKQERLKCDRNELGLQRRTPPMFHYNRKTSVRGIEYLYKIGVA